MNIGALVEKAVHTIPQNGIWLGDGSDGVVYAVDDSVALKLFWGEHPRFSYSREHAEHEFEIGSDLHSKGAQVPQYFGIFQPVDLEGLNYWGIFMERIYAVKNIAELPQKLKRKAEHQHEEQSRFIRRLGYSFMDYGIHRNKLFDVDKEKLFFIDFVSWKRIKN